MNCDICLRLFRHKGKPTGKIKKGRREWKCGYCGHKQLEPIKQGISGEAKVLVYDIETSTATYKTYPSTRPQFLRGDQLIQRPYVMGWSAKWLLDDDITARFVNSPEAQDRNEERVVRALHKKMSKTDYVITYNGDGFDDKEMTARFVKYDLLPITYKSIDLYKKVKQICRLPSYSLRFVLDYFGLTPKGHRERTDLAEMGDVKALKHDKEYCKQDVISTEALYLKLRPYMKTHPNLSALMDHYHPLEDDEIYCPRCGEVVHAWVWNKTYRTPAGNVHRACNCPHCKGIIYQTKKLNGRSGVK